MADEDTPAPGPSLGILYPQHEGEDDDRYVGRLFLMYLKRQLTEASNELKAADLELIRKSLSDNNLTFSMVKRGGFGDFAKNFVEEQYPFPEEGSRVQ